MQGRPGARLIAVVGGRSCVIPEDAAASGLGASCRLVRIRLGWLPLRLQAEVTHARSPVTRCHVSASIIVNPARCLLNERQDCLSTMKSDFTCAIPWFI
jgi:hypothetical protein